MARNPESRAVSIILVGVKIVAAAGMAVGLYKAAEAVPQDLSLIATQVKMDKAFLAGDLAAGAKLLQDQGSQAQQQIDTTEQAIVIGGPSLVIFAAASLLSRKRPGNLEASAPNDPAPGSPTR